MLNQSNILGTEKVDIVFLLGRACVGRYCKQSGMFKAHYRRIERCYKPVYKCLRYLLIIQSGQSFKMMFYIVIIITVCLLLEKGGGRVALNFNADCFSIGHNPFLGNNCNAVHVFYMDLFRVF